MKIATGLIAALALGLGALTLKDSDPAPPTQTVTVIQAPEPPHDPYNDPPPGYGSSSGY